MQPERTSHPKRVAAISIRDLEGEIMVKLIKADFDGQVMQFNDNGMFNATVAAEAMGKRLDHWLSNKETQDYIAALNARNLGDLMITKKGRNGGTWLHPKLAVPFARWCSVDFAIWCDEQIDAIVHGSNKSIDWGMMRHASKSSNKVANEILMMVRQEQGKETKHFHYANEAKLVNYALTGKFEPVNRDSLSAQDLDLLASLENRNSVLIGRDVDRETRKEILCQMVSAARLKLLK